MKLSFFFLAGLRLDYDSFVTLVTTRVDPLSIEDLYGHLLVHEICLNSSNQLSILHLLEQTLQVEEILVGVVVVSTTLSLHLVVSHPPLPRKIIEASGVDMEIQILPLQIV